MPRIDSLSVATISRTGWPWWLETWHTGQTTSSIWRARLWIPYLAVPVGLALLCLQFLAEMWMVWTGRQEPFVVPGPEST